MPLPLFIPAKPRMRRKHALVAPLTPAPTVSVYAVYVETDNGLAFEFSSNVTACPANCPQLMADGGGGMIAPIETVQIGDDLVLAIYPGVSFVESVPWQIIAPPEGIVFADGTLIVPESGTSE